MGRASSVAPPLCRLAAAWAWLALASLTVPLAAARSGGSTTPANATVANAEVSALLEIRSGFTNSQAMLADWSAEASSPCSWVGVQCGRMGTVTGLNLSGLGLTGTIEPAGWSQLTSLVGLVLSDNVLTGTLPQPWDLPANLSLLSLESNRLTGPIDPAWQLPPALTELHLNANFLNGSLSRAWALPPGLVRLELGHNLLTGSLEGWVLPTSLLFLDLSENNLSGPLEGWALPTGLHVLQLANNSLTGTLPDDFGLFLSLLELDLSGNNFEAIPEGWTLPASLLELDLSGNGLQANIHANIVLPEELQILRLHDNALVGSLPPALPRGLQELTLQQNNFTGGLPSEWVELPESLSTLRLDNNALAGPLFSNWTLPPGLTQLTLSGNAFTSTIPPDWQLPDTIMELRLDSNPNLAGTLPDGWELPNLVIATVYGNNLTGTLPAWQTPNDSAVIVLPAPRLCGQVPAETPYYWFDPNYFVSYTVTGLPGKVYINASYRVDGDDLPSCPSQGGGGANVGVFVGVSVGCTAAVCLTGFAVLWRLRARRHSMRRRHSSSKQNSVAGAPSGRAPSGAQPPQQPAPSPWHARNVHQWLEMAGLGRELAASGPRGQGQDDSAKDIDRWDLASATENGSIPAGSAMDSGRPLLPPSANGPSSSRSAGGSSLQNDPVLALARRAANSHGSGTGHSGGSTPSIARGGVPLDLNLWLIDFHALQLEKLVGDGSFGRVYLARWQGAPVAVKVLLNTGVDVDDEAALGRALTLSDPLLVNLQKEAGLMAALRHPNVVHFLGVCTAPPCVVTEFCARGSLADVFRAARQSPGVAARLDWPRRLRMMLDTATGMLHLHSHRPPIAHRDLKSPNLLVDEHWRVKVSDFNLSKILGDSAMLSSAQATNPRWLAPEVLEGQPATLQSDVYSFGIVLWEALTSEVPFAGDNHWQLVKYVAAGGRPRIPDPHILAGKGGGSSFGGLETYVALMQRCWAQAPEERPSFQEISSALRAMLVAASGSGSGHSSRDGGGRQSRISEDTSPASSTPTAAPLQPRSPFGPSPVATPASQPRASPFAASPFAAALQGMT